MYKEPVTTEAAAATLAASKCQWCTACYICRITITAPDFDLASVAGIWGID